MTCASALGNGDSSEVPDSIEGDVLADYAKLGCVIWRRVWDRPFGTEATDRFS